MFYHNFILLAYEATLKATFLKLDQSCHLELERNQRQEQKLILDRSQMPQLLFE